MSGKLPTVAIVGRANAGKSSLFNRLINRRQAIVARESGTTRDAVMGELEVDGGVLLLLDTAGLKHPDDDFEATIQDQIADIAVSADVLLVAVDGTAPVSQEDRAVAKLAHKSGKPAILVINKTEGSRDVARFAEFFRLGIEPVVLVSALHNQGMDELMAAILQFVKPRARQAKDDLTVALVGRPNAGKSSLFNSLASGRVALVAETAGTTRDVNRATAKSSGREFTLLDTAGIRRAGKINRGIERFSVNRALTAIAEADVVLLVIDATEPGVALEQKLAGIIKEAGKGLILVATKWDLVDKDAYTHDELLAKLRSDFQHVPWALFSVTSAVSKQNLGRLLELVMLIAAERSKQLKTSELNRWLTRVTATHPPAGLRNLHPKLKYMTQTGANPPQFTIFGRNSRVLHFSYKRYLERELRETFGFAGTPVNFRFEDDKR